MKAVGLPPTTSGIRPLRREDLPAVAALYELVARSGTRTPPPGLADHFAETLLDHPWADDEIPSLINEEADGTISGFIGSHVRRFVLDGRPIRVACGGQLVTDPSVRNRAVGLFLLREFMGGAQDLAITDTAGEATRLMWTRIGGRLAYLHAISWFRPFRPLQFTLDFVAMRRRGGSTARNAPAALLGRGPFRPRADSTAAADVLTPASLAESLSELGDAFQLRPAYDEPFLAWLFGQLSAVSSRGTLVARRVNGARGILGWYVYYLRPGGLSDVLQVVAAPEREREVLDDLFRHARGNGAALLRGRVEPRLLDPLARRRCLFRYNGAALVHSRDPAVTATIDTGRALLTRMEGEWWMGHHLEPFGAQA